MAKTKYPVPSDEEEKAINAGIAADSDNPEWGDEMFAHAKRGPGRPYAEQTKERITVRLDADIVEWLKASGKGYQTRMNTLLRNIMQMNG